MKLKRSTRRKVKKFCIRDYSVIRWIPTVDGEGEVMWCDVCQARQEKGTYVRPCNRNPDHVCVRDRYGWCTAPNSDWPEEERSGLWAALKEIW